MCYTKREWIIFFIGAEAFHTLTHLLMAFNGLPIQFFNITITHSLNMWALIFNALITAGLIYWAQKTK